MFTGIVQAVGRIGAVRRTRSGTHLAIDLPFEVGKGGSVAVNGVCLTWTGDGFDVIPETLSRTNLGALRKGDRVNLEPALRTGDPLGSHFVQGHVDGVGAIASLSRARRETKMWIDLAAEISLYLAPKGSITVDGVGLTLVDVEPDRFSVALIPFTLKHTTLGRARRGQKVNLEIDLLARYAKKGNRITRAFLERAGFA